MYFGEENYRFIKTMLSTSRTYTESKVVIVSRAWWHRPIISACQETEPEESHVQVLPELQREFKAILSENENPKRALVVQYSTWLDDVKA